MHGPSLTAEEAIRWNEATTNVWRKVFEEHPELLKQPCDIAKASVVGQLMQHIVAAELRYAERLADLPVSDYDSLPYDSAAAIFGVHDRAMAIFCELLTGDVDWEEPFEFMTRSFGRARSNRKTVFFHALFHGQRHYAQLATLVRKYDVKPSYPTDFLFVNIERV